MFSLVIGAVSALRVEEQHKLAQSNSERKLQPSPGQGQPLVLVEARNKTVQVHLCLQTSRKCILIYFGQIEKLEKEWAEKVAKRHAMGLLVVWETGDPGSQSINLAFIMRQFRTIQYAQRLSTARNSTNRLN